MLLKAAMCSVLRNESIANIIDAKAQQFPATRRAIEAARAACNALDLDSPELPALRDELARLQGL